MKRVGILLICFPVLAFSQKRKTVVLTFDDAVKSQYSFVAPILKQYHFRATFYVCEFPRMWGDSANSMNWQQIKELSDMGFEIGNHTWHHRNLPGLTAAELNNELSYIENKCNSLGIPKPSSFAYPAYHTDSAAIPILKQHGYTTARTCGDRAYDIKNDDPLYLPSFTITGDDSAYFFNALKQADKGKPVVFTIHGVPDKLHPWVTTPPEVFKKYLQYLHDHHYRVIAMRDLRIKDNPDLCGQSLQQELKNFSDPSRLPVLRRGTVVGQVSTYDTTGGNNDGFAGTYSFIRRNPDSTLVIFDQEGPGSINRIWTPTPTADTLDFYIDGRLALSICYLDLFSGKVFPFVAPLCGTAVGGYFCYFPILFERHCTIVYRGHHLQFHQVQYRLYPKGTKLKSFSGSLTESEKRLLNKAFAVSPVPAGARIAETAGGSIDLKQGGRIEGIELLPAGELSDSASILIRFDGRTTVDAPLTAFFGYGFQGPAMQSWLIGTRGNLHYCYFPMPFDQEASVSFPHFKGTAKVYYSKRKRQLSEGRFYARFAKDSLTVNDPYHVFLDTNGEGHYVGTILLARGIGVDGTPFFEGDDITITDGLTRIHGTGSEDYFNGGWYNIKGRWDTVRSLPMHGCLGYSAPLSRTGGYRFYLSDKIPFQKNIFEAIEHGGSKRGAPAFYRSLAFYYLK